MCNPAIGRFLLGKLCKTCCGKLALRFWMGCKAQAAAIAVLWRGFATPQHAKTRRCQQRRRFCRASLGLALVFGAVSMAAAQPAKTLKLSHQWQTGDARDKGARLFAKEVEKRDKSFRFRIYSGASLISSPVKQIDALMDGAVDLAIFPLIYGVGRAPDFSATIIPGVASSIIDAKRLQGTEFETIVQEIARESGFHILTWWWMEGGIANRVRPTTDPQSVNGLKFRGADRTIDQMLREAGASVFSMPSTELYSALQTGVLDGLMTTYDSLMSMRIYEQVKYATVGGEYTTFVVFNPLVIATKVWDALTPAQQTAFTEAGRATQDEFDRLQREARQNVVERFRAAGVETRAMTQEEYAAWLRLAKNTAWPAFAATSERAARLLQAAARP